MSNNINNMLLNLQILKEKYSVSQRNNGNDNHSNKQKQPEHFSHSIQEQHRVIESESPPIGRGFLLLPPVL